MRTRARLLSGAMCLLVLATAGAILFIGFLPAYAQGDEERTVSTPASRAPYVPLQAQSVNVNITQIDPSKFPIIELYTLVTDQDGNTIPGLTASNFLATEQSNLESQPTTETISVAPITVTGNIAVALTIDRSGSMGGSKIADAKTAANAFIDNLALLDRAAIISFSSSVTINQAFTSDKTALHNAVNSLSAGGNTAVYDAIYKSVEELTSEIGVKAVIIFTDGQSNSDSHSVQEAIDLAKDRGIPVYTIGLGSSVNESILQTIANETGGYYTFAPTAADLQQIYNDIAQAIRDQYLVTYSTHNPNYDGTTRTVEVTVTVGANSDSDTATYTVTEPPEISLTQDTLNLMAQAQYAGQTLTIGAIITDDVSVTQAKLFYRTSGSGDIYKEVLMTSSSDLYTADIPGSDIATPGVDFYITASDGTLTSSSPQNNPATYPHQISILPNEAPVIDHTPVTTATVGTNVVISANVTDTTDYVDSVKLFYRTTGYVLYDSADMVSSSDTYVATIPGSKVTLAGIDYYILASDNHTVRTYDGTDVAPHHIDVTSGPTNHPPDTKIETADIDVSQGTAKFTWSGSDDNTPPAQLVYKHRLLNPDSPLYDWSNWSSSTTATYPRSPDSRLPDGTYRFQVKAKDADEAIQPDSATWEFTMGAGAPGTISGRVTDASIPGPSNGIAGAVLLLDPDPFTYCPVTLDQGYFSFSIPAGTYNVTTSASGYSTLTKSVTVIAGEPTEVNFALTPTLPCPTLVQDFSASDGEDSRSTLGWTNPSDSDLGEVIVRRKTEGYPDHYSDGVLVYRDPSPKPGGWSQYEDSNLSNGETYYYGVFSKDTSGHWNNSVQEGKNADTATPSLGTFKPGDLVRATRKLNVRNDENEDVGDVFAGYGGTIEGSSRIREVDDVEYVFWKIRWDWKLSENGADIPLGEDEGIVGWTAEGSSTGKWLLTDDVYWLAKVLTNEARGQDELARRAVGYTVLNRLDYGSEFGSDIHGVVIASNGYAPSWDKPHHEPTRSDIVGRAKSILAGEVSDPTDGATHFFSPMSQAGTSKHPVPGTAKEAYYAWWAKPKGGWDVLSDTLTHYVNIDNREWRPLEEISTWEFMFYRPYTTRVTAAVRSPVELRVIDSEGRVTGLVGGEVVTEIPDTAYHDNTVTIFFPLGFYRYEIEGTNDGSYSLTVSAVTRDGNIDFVATDIPAKADSNHRYSIRWDVLAQSEEGVTVQVDADGDGTFEQTITSGSELGGEDFGVITTEEFVSHGPNPVTGGGTTFFYALPAGTSTAKLMIFNVAGRLLFETSLDVGASRFPSAGTWNPVDQDGVLLANGPYVYVLIADGKVIGQGKMVIQR